MNLAEIIIGVHLLSGHSAGGFESVTPGIYAVTPEGTTAGILRNSEKRLSLYVGKTYETEDRRWALTVGGITGYTSTPLVPLAVPSFRLKVSDQAAWRLSFLPRAPKVGTSAAVHLSLELTGLLR